VRQFVASTTKASNEKRHEMNGKATFKKANHIFKNNSLTKHISMGAAQSRFIQKFYKAVPNLIITDTKADLK
jgi:hypothetical protein